MSDNISDGYINTKVDMLFDEWGYREDMTVYRCVQEDTLFIRVIAKTSSKYDFPISLRDLEFYQNIYNKGVKTLLMFFCEESVYYGFLSDVRVTIESKTAYVDLEDMKEINFNDRENGKTL